MLFLIATPIGNLEDITLRALRVLKEVDLILAEDTRKSGLMLKFFNIVKPLESFYEHNEERRLAHVIELLKSGKNIALVSSAGMPTISDPGYKLVRECRCQKIPVTALPGPSSIINALSLSSLPREKFTFLGYLPRKSGQRQKTLKEYGAGEAAVVVLESPFRMESSLEDIQAALPDCRLTVTREMTKKFEEVWEGDISEAVVKYKGNKHKGEFVLIISNRVEKTKD